MIAAARIGLRYVVLLPIQRWLLLVGAVLCAFGVTMTVTGTPGRPLFFLGLVTMHLPAAIVAGVAFRHLSACRTNALAPHFRRTMLASLLLTAAGIALIWHFSAPLWLGAADPAAVPRLATLLLPFAGASLFVLGAVIGSASVTAFLVVLAATIAGDTWLRMDGVALIRDAGIDPILLAAAGSAAVWGVFAAWYLGTPHVAPPSWRPVPRRFGTSSTEPGQATVSSAEVSYLTGMLDSNAPAWNARTMLTYAALLAAGWLLPRILPDHFSTPGRLVYLLAIVGGILVLQAGTQRAHEARRARLLWLTHTSREDIFRMCERRSLGQGIWMSAVYLVLLGPWVLRVFGPAGVAWVAALTAAAASAGGYLGLMAVRGWRVPDVAIGCALLFSVYGATPFVIFHLEDAPRVPAAVLAALLAIAITCRTIAERRWRRIDWLRLRPLRWLAGSGSFSRFGQRSA